MKDDIKNAGKVVNSTFATNFFTKFIFWFLIFQLNKFQNLEYLCFENTVKKNP